MPAYRYFEIISYALLYFIPCLFLAYYPFRKELRFSKAVTAIGITLITAVQVISHFYTAYNEQMWQMALGEMFVVAFLFSLSVKSHPGKALFTYLMLCNISNFVFCAAKCFEGLVFPNFASEHYRFSNIITLIFAQALILIPLFFFFIKPYDRTLNEDKNPTVWKYIYLVPLTFYSVWFRNFHFSAEGSEVLALRPQHLLYTLVINSGALLIYTLIVKLINEQKDNTALREKEHLFTLQQAQYDNLHERIEEARTAKHDIRQHIHIISAYVKDKKYDELEDYVNAYRKSIPESNSEIYCEHYEVNALLQYFSGLANHNGIAFSSQVQLPKDMGISNDSLTVLLGNLLENAVHACQSENGAFITVKGMIDENGVFFKIINTFTGKVKKAPNGLYLSTKHDGRGIGLRSVRNIVKNHNGMLKISHEDGFFTVSVLLNTQNQP